MNLPYIHGHNHLAKDGKTVKTPRILYGVFTHPPRSRPTISRYATIALIRFTIYVCHYPSIDLQERIVSESSHGHVVVGQSLKVFAVQLSCVYPQRFGTGIIAAPPLARCPHFRCRLA